MLQNKTDGKKIMAFVNFKGGVGKSLHASIFQTYLDKSIILNLDNQDAKKINVGDTINVLTFMDELNTTTEEVLDISLEQYDNIIIDTAGKELTEELLEIIEYIDYFIVPFQEDTGVIDYTVDTMDTLFNSGVFEDKKDVIFLLNMYKKEEERKEYTEILMEEISKREGLLENINVNHVAFKHSDAIKTIKRKNKTIEELKKESFVAYRVVENNFKRLHSELKEYMGIES